MRRLRRRNAPANTGPRSARAILARPASHRSRCEPAERPVLVDCQRVPHEVEALAGGVAVVDAIVAEGFEAGGHNGREETTTLCLLPLVRDVVNVPLLAAGGIGSGRAMLAAEALGADGVQIGTRFAASLESSAHENFKSKLVNLGEGETILTMKQLTPVRLIKNKFYQRIAEAEKAGLSIDEVKKILGKGRAKQGIFEGDLDEGELEIGQAASYVKGVKPASEILMEIWEEYLVAKKSLT